MPNINWNELLPRQPPTPDSPLLGDLEDFARWAEEQFPNLQLSVDRVKAFALTELPLVKLQVRGRVVPRDWDALTFRIQHDGALTPRGSDAPEIRTGAELLEYLKSTQLMESLAQLNRDFEDVTGELRTQEPWTFTSMDVGIRLSRLEYQKVLDPKAGTLEIEFTIPDPPTHQRFVPGQRYTYLTVEGCEAEILEQPQVQGGKGVVKVALRPGSNSVWGAP